MGEVVVGTLLGLIIGGGIVLIGMLAGSWIMGK